MKAAALQSPAVLESPISDDVQQGHQFEWIEFMRIAIVGVSAAIAWSGAIPRFHGFDLLALAATLVGGYPVFEEAISNLLARRMTMELSMTIALISALAIREYFTALIILLFVLIAEVLEEMTVDRGRRAIQTLLDLLPNRATVRREAGTVELSIEHVRPGDIVVVKPGAEIPVDGTVVRGHAFVDQSSITGESAAVEKVVGGSVFAGTTNLSGALEINTLKLGRDTVFGKIVEAVERAEQSKAPVQRLADRLAGYLVYVALAAALITFAMSRDIRATIAVIIVAGACGIAAGTPLAILGAIGRAAQRGAIVKGGLYLETLGKIDTVVLDKTGTLTFGNPEVVEIIAVRGFGEDAVIEAAAVAERPSEHPAAKAILKKASQLGLSVIEPDRFDYFPGKEYRLLVAVGSSCRRQPEPALGKRFSAKSIRIPSRGGKLHFGRTQWPVARVHSNRRPTSPRSHFSGAGAEEDEPSRGVIDRRFRDDCKRGRSEVGCRCGSGRVAASSKARSYREADGGR